MPIPVNPCEISKDHLVQSSSLSRWCGITVRGDMIFTSDRFPANGKWNVKWEKLNSMH